MTGTAPRPLLALTAGDPAGIGPELVAKVLARPALLDAARVVAIGPAAVRPAGLADFAPGRPPARAAWLVTDGPPEWEMGRAQAACGAAALAALRAGAELASTGV
jgi:4-hydroxythreonine-4-phosphate dehydrogenase